MKTDRQRLSNERTVFNMQLHGYYVTLSVIWLCSACIRQPTGEHTPGEDGCVVDALLIEQRRSRGRALRASALGHNQQEGSRIFSSMNATCCCTEACSACMHAVEAAWGQAAHDAWPTSPLGGKFFHMMAKPKPSLQHDRACSPQP